MPIHSSSFGSLSQVRNIPVGEVIILPTSKGTGVAITVRARLETESVYLAWLSPPQNAGQKQFELENSAHYANNLAVVLTDAELLLSAKPRHVLAWENAIDPGIIICDATHKFIVLGHGELARYVDLATGYYVARPNKDLAAVVYTSWSLVRRYEENGRTVTVPFCEWELHAAKQ